MSKSTRIWGYRLADAAPLWRAGVSQLRMLTEDGVSFAMRRRVKPRFWLFMIAITLIVFCASFAVLRYRYGLGQRRLLQVQAERDALSLEVSALSDRLEYAQTDDYIMRTARDELGMILPGEVRYVNGAR